MCDWFSRGKFRRRYTKSCGISGMPTSRVSKRMARSYLASSSLEIAEHVAWVRAGAKFPAQVAETELATSRWGRSPIKLNMPMNRRHGSQLEGGELRMAISLSRTAWRMNQFQTPNRKCCSFDPNQIAGGAFGWGFLADECTMKVREGGGRLADMRDACAPQRHAPRAARLRPLLRRMAARPARVSGEPPETDGPAARSTRRFRRCRNRQWPADFFLPAFANNPSAGLRFHGTVAFFGEGFAFCFRREEERDEAD